MSYIIPTIQFALHGWERRDSSSRNLKANGRYVPQLGRHDHQVRGGHQLNSISSYVGAIHRQIGHIGGSFEVLSWGTSKASVFPLPGIWRVTKKVN